jgi:hypothetical protein
MGTAPNKVAVFRSAHNVNEATIVQQPPATTPLLPAWPSKMCCSIRELVPPLGPALRSPHDATAPDAKALHSRAEQEILATTVLSYHPLIFSGRQRVALESSYTQLSCAWAISHMMGIHIFGFGFA